MKIATLSLLAAAGSFIDRAAAQACAPLHMIAARGSTESQSSNNGVGVLAVITNGVTAQVPGADAIGIVYPATLTSYDTSVAAGDKAMTQAIIDYSTKCPTSKIALLGYSQGGQVVGDALCGNSENGFTQTSPLPLQYASNIVAIVSAADPARTQGELGVTELGNATLFGGFTRRNTTSCAPYEGRYGLWCNADDLFCAAGKSLTVHLTIISAYRTDMINYIVSRYYQSVGQTPPPSNSTSSASASTLLPTVSTSALSSFGVSSVPTAAPTTSAPYLNATTTTRPAGNTTLVLPTLTLPPQTTGPTSTTSAVSTAGAVQELASHAFAGAGAIVAIAAALL